MTNSALIVMLLTMSINIIYAGENSIDQDTLAIVSGKPITASEFKERFDLSIYPGKETISALDAIKEKFLLSMVAEVLLAEEGIKSGKFINSETEELERSATETFLRDVLYRKEILSKVRITNEMVGRALVNAGYIYTVLVLHFGDSTRAALFYHQCRLLDQNSLNAVLAMNRIATDTVSVRYGVLLESQENAFWGKDAGYMTEPIKGQSQYIVIKVLEKKYDPEFLRLSREQKEFTVRRLLQTREELARTQNYVGNLFGRINVKIEPLAMALLADSLASILRKEIPTYISGVYLLDQKLTSELREKLNHELDFPLLKIYKSSDEPSPEVILLRMAINGLEEAEFKAVDTTREAVMVALRAALRRFVEYHLLAERSRDLGLANSLEVKHNVDMIMSAYFAGEMRKAITDTVRLSDEDINEFMKDYKSSALSRISMVVEEFHFPTIDAAVRAFELLNEKGSAIDTTILAMATKVDTLRQSAYLLRSIGISFSESQPGAVYGPVQRGSEYVLYKLLNRSNAETDASIKIEEHLIKQLALEEKKNAVVARYVAHLADRAKLKIFIEKLKNVSVEPVQIFTIRNIGFGGKINAVPALIQCEDWPKEARRIKEMIVP